MTESPLKVTKRSKKIVPKFHVIGCQAFADGNCDKDCDAMWWEAYGTGYVSTLGLSATERAALISAEKEAAAQTHDTRIAWCGVPTGDGYRARCSCGWMGEPSPMKSVAVVDELDHLKEAAGG